MKKICAKCSQCRRQYSPILARVLPSSDVTDDELLGWKALHLKNYELIPDLWILTLNFSPNYFAYDRVQWYQLCPEEQYYLMCSEVEKYYRNCRFIWGPGKCVSGLLHVHVLIRPEKFVTKYQMKNCQARMLRNLELDSPASKLEPIRDLQLSIKYINKNRREWWYKKPSFGGDGRGYTIQKSTLQPQDTLNLEGCPRIAEGVDFDELFDQLSYLELRKKWSKKEIIKWLKKKLKKA